MVVVLVGVPMCRLIFELTSNYSSYTLLEVIQTSLTSALFGWSVVLT